MKKLRMKRYDYIESQKRPHKLTYDMDFCDLVLREFYDLIRSAWEATRKDPVSRMFNQYCWFINSNDAPGWVYYGREIERCRFLLSLGWLAKHSERIRFELVLKALEDHE